MKWTSSVVAGAAIFGMLGAFALSFNAAPAQAEVAANELPSYNDQGELVLPKGWRRWVYVGSPLTPNGLNGGAAGFPEYHNVYIQPSAMDHFEKTGEFPEGTILFKELMTVGFSSHDDGSSDQVSGRGFFPGKFNGADVAVKDSKKYGDTNNWGYFNFGHAGEPYAKSAAATPKEACAQCHIDNAANDMVFTQFYPLLQK